MGINTRSGLVRSPCRDGQHPWLSLMSIFKRSPLPTTLLMHAPMPTMNAGPHPWRETEGGEKGGRKGRGESHASLFPLHKYPWNATSTYSAPCSWQTIETRTVAVASLTQPTKKHEHSGGKRPKWSEKREVKVVGNGTGEWEKTARRVVPNAGTLWRDVCTATPPLHAGNNFSLPVFFPPLRPARAAFRNDHHNGTSPLRSREG